MRYFSNDYMKYCVFCEFFVCLYCIEYNEYKKLDVRMVFKLK